MATGADLNTLLSSLGANLAYFDDEANRARSEHAQRLRQIASLGMSRRKSLADSMASTGMVHSSANLDSQVETGNVLDEARASAGQSLSDRLANIARQRIQAEAGFNINSLMPR